MTPLAVIASRNVHFDADALRQSGLLRRGLRAESDYAPAKRECLLRYLPRLRPASPLPAPNRPFIVAAAKVRSWRELSVEFVAVFGFLKEPAKGDLVLRSQEPFVFSGPSRPVQ